VEIRMTNFDLRMKETLLGRANLDKADLELIRIPSSVGIGSQRKVSEGPENFGW
jgi:hypothetical protein